jgi:serine/threonine protein kinase
MMTEEDLFHRALEAPEAERAALLAAACGDDDALRRRVELLLRMHQNPGTFLAAPAVETPTHAYPADGHTPPAPAADATGTRVGPYKLLQLIGEGGMGAVYLAEQQVPVRRQVALKLVKAGMDSRAVLARFEAERQALALMDHPNIARVLDAGATETGRPYFVMELVKGVSITRFCDEKRVGLRERVGLFADVCRAVQHAHQKGVIHRDLKPSNVLVALYDGRPVPKVIDFGVAKAAGTRLTDKTLFTGFGTVVGTPEYMSPEQAELNQLDVDTRSDVYSLGVLLYELLTGTTPLDRERVRRSSVLEVLRLVREEEPPRPSARLGSAADPRRLAGLVRGELDWIAMRCLEKDRARRYQSPGELADDLARYLADEPVQACPPSAAYRFHKFARRHRAAILLAAAFAGLLVAGAGVSAWQAVRATRAQGNARAAQADAEANLRRAHRAVNDSFTRVSEDTLLRQPTLEPLRKQLLQDALRYYREFAREHADDPGFQTELAAAHFRIAILGYELGPEDDWLASFETGVALVEDLLRRNPDRAALEPLHGGFRWAGLAVWWQVSRPADAHKAFETARGLWQRLAREHPDVPGFRSDLAAFHLLLGLIRASLYEHAASVAEYQAAAALWRDLLAADPRPDYRTGLVHTLTNAATQYAALGRAAEAEAVGREAVAVADRLAADAPGVPAYEELLHGFASPVIGLMLDGLGKDAVAEELLRRAEGGLTALTRRYPTVERYTTVLIRVRIDLGELLWAGDRRDEAAAVFRSIHDLAAGFGPGDGPGELAWLLASAPDPRFRDLPRAVAIATRNAERNPDGRSSWSTLGTAHYRAGEYRAAIAALERLLRRPDSFAGEAELFLAMALWQLGERDAARARYARAAAWSDRHVLPIAQVVRHRREAAALLGIDDPKLK